MGERSGFDLMSFLRDYVAIFAMWFCGPVHLFWAAPEEWEEYIAGGKPLSQCAQMPCRVFDAIQNKLGDPDLYDADAEHICEWLYSGEVMVIEP